MSTPWLEISRSEDREKQAGPSFSDYNWQALFACQVGIPTHGEWARLKWGFNASALFDEFLERQRLFLEAQYTIRNEMRLENPDGHTLAFRYIQRPGEGLQLGLLGKVHARTEKEAADRATAFYRGIVSTFPYDYSLTPASNRLDFSQISGQDILIDSQSSLWLAQIRRVEIPVTPDQKSPFLQGLWQTSAHAHEVIWRSLALAPTPVILNLQLRSTILYEREQKILMTINRQVGEMDESLISQKALTAIQEWSTRYSERRLTPWKKFFYLQIHLAASGDLDENLCRIVGTSLTLPAERESLPGYQVSVPTHDEIPIWRKKLMDLSLISPVSRLSVPRLADVADIDEVFAALRLPYSPPDNGFPDFNFASTVNK